MSSKHSQPPYHPVINLLLYIFGTEVKETISSDITENNLSVKSKSKLSWKDEHGDHIAEYISKIQVQRDDTPKFTNNISNNTSASSNSEYNSNQNISDSEKSKNTSDNFGNNEIFSKDLSKSMTRSVVPVESPSPQYGFFISITPPTEPIFKKPVDVDDSN